MWWPKLCLDKTNTRASCGISPRQHANCVVGDCLTKFSMARLHDEVHGTLNMERRQEERARDSPNRPSPSCLCTGRAIMPDHEPFDATKRATSVSFQAHALRILIMVSYVAVLLAGVPVWWYMTSITRLPLPKARVEAIDWTESVRCA